MLKQFNQCNQMTAIPQIIPDAHIPHLAALCSERANEYGEGVYQAELCGLSEEFHALSPAAKGLLMLAADLIADGL